MLFNVREPKRGQRRGLTSLIVRKQTSQLPAVAYRANLLINQQEKFCGYYEKLQVQNGKCCSPLLTFSCKDSSASTSACLHPPR